MQEHSYRIERDSMGEVRVPATALWGAQTQRAVENFQIGSQPICRELIEGLGLVKAAAARANAALGLIDSTVTEAIAAAALEVAAGRYDEHFPVDIYQTGSGTSSNMNANEVIARLAGASLGHPVHPNDVVNFGQSSNDTIPTVIHVAAALGWQRSLEPALMHASSVLLQREHEFYAVAKTGRTHLMDAMPLTLGQEISAWRVHFDTARERFSSALPRLASLAQGGTAVGTAINCHPDFAEHFCIELRRQTGIDFRSAGNYFAALAMPDSALEFSGHARNLAASLIKICNDLRWMNSGPLAGLGEITLPALQPGSSIMPGKVNPVVPEAVAMAATQVMGLDTAIVLGAQSGSFQLNVMLPLIGQNLLTQLRLLSNAVRSLADQALCSFSANRDVLARALALNPVLVTALNARIGYDNAAAIAKRAYAERRPVIDVAVEMTAIPRAELEQLLDPLLLTRGGLAGDGGGG